MATTTLMPLDPALSEERVNRVLTISVSLIPDEVVAARRARRTRTWVLTALAVVVAALGGWYVDAGRDTGRAQQELSDATAQVVRLQNDQRDYAPVVNAKGETTAINDRLAKLLAQDLPWATLLRTLRTAGTESGVAVEGVSGSLRTETDRTGTGTLPSTSGATAVGSVTVTGVGPDKPSIARYVDALDEASEMVQNPYLTTATQGEDRQVRFTLTIEITQSAFCGRFTTTCETTGGN